MFLNGLVARDCSSDLGAKPWVLSYANKVQQTREKLLDRAHDHQQRIKQDFYRKVRKEDFQLGDLVLKWDAPKKYKGKHGKFEALWI
jgi:hypothetical protein